MLAENVRAIAVSRGHAQTYQVKRSSRDDTPA